jgi:hypothetical protein
VAILLKTHCDVTPGGVCKTLNLMDHHYGGDHKRKIPDIAQLVERLTVDQLVVCSIHTVRI